MANGYNGRGYKSNTSNNRDSMAINTIMDVEKYIVNGYLKIIVKPSSPKTEIVGYDSERKALRINIHAKPEDNKANIEVIKFFTKLLKRKVSIKTGLKNKEKILQIHK